MSSSSLLFKKVLIVICMSSVSFFSGSSILSIPIIVFISGFIWLMDLTMGINRFWILLKVNIAVCSLLFILIILFAFGLKLVNPDLIEITNPFKKKKD